MGRRRSRVARGRVAVVVMSVAAGLLATTAIGAPARAVDDEWTLSPKGPVIGWWDAALLNYDDVYPVAGLYDGGRLWLYIHKRDANDHLLWTQDIEAPATFFNQPSATWPRGSGFDDPDLPVDFSAWGGNGIVCEKHDVRLDVHDVTRDARGRVTRMWGDWQAICGGDPEHGYFRWGYPDQAANPPAYSWAYGAPPGLPAGIGVFRLPEAVDAGGEHASDLKIAQGLCTAGICDYEVTFRPGAAGHRHATIDLPGDQPGDVVDVESRGLPGRFRAVVNGEEFAPPPSWMWVKGDRLSMRRAAWQGGGGYDLWVEGLHGLEPDRQYELGSEAWITIYYQGPNEEGGPDSCTPEQGQLVVHQARRGPEPAYSVEFSATCSFDGTFEGTFEYGARDDVTGPARVLDLRVDAGRLRWTPTADAVRSVVRVRRGGSGSTQWDDGLLVYSGSGRTVPVPEQYLGRSAAFTVFTFDEAGNVSKPRTVIQRGRQHLSLSASTSRTRPTERVLLQGEIRDADWGYRQDGRQVTLQAHRSRQPWQTVTQVSSNAMGQYALTVRPRRTTYYRTLVAPTSALHGDTSPTRLVRVN